MTKHLTLIGKNILPLMELLNKKGNHMFLIEFLGGSRELRFRNTIPVLIEVEYKQIVITKKDYKRLIVLIGIMDNPLEAFESIYSI